MMVVAQAGLQVEARRGRPVILGKKADRTIGIGAEQRRGAVVGVTQLLAVEVHASHEGVVLAQLVQIAGLGVVGGLVGLESHRVGEHIAPEIGNGALEGEAAGTHAVVGVHGIDGVALAGVRHEIGRAAQRVQVVAHGLLLAAAPALEGAGVAHGQLAMGVGVVKQPRVHREVAHAGHVHEAVAVHVHVLLAREAREYRVAKPLPALRREAVEVGFAQRGLVEGSCELRRAEGRRFAHQVHQARDGPAAEKRGVGALQQLNLAQIERRHRQDAEAAREAAVQGQPIAQNLRILPLQALDAQIGVAGSRRGGLNLGARNVAEQAGDVAGLDAVFLLHLLLAQHLDALGLVFDARVGAGGRYDHFVDFGGARGQQ